MDARHTLDALAPKPDEHVLDAGCGTGRHLGPMIFLKQPGRRRLSRGMLNVAQRNYLEVPLMLGDLQRDLCPSKTSASTPCCAP